MMVSTLLDSVLYDGGGTANALQLEADSAAVVAGGAAVIPTAKHDVLDILVVNAAAGESCTLWITEYTGSTPTVANQIRQTDATIPTDDLAGEVDLQMVGLSSAVGYAKAAVRLRVTPGHYVMISLAAQSASGAKYCRYMLTDADSGDDLDWEPSGTSRATSALQTTGNALLTDIEDAAGNIAKGGRKDSVSPTFLEKANSTARVDGTSVGAEALADSTIPYVRATVRAAKPVADADKVAIANVGTVYICKSATDIDGAFPLEPGQSMALPDNCNLTDFFLAVDNANDGVSIVYTV